jgi:hypothetical protein
MKKFWYTFLAAQLLAGTGGVMAQTVEQVVDGMLRAENDGFNDIDNYMLKSNTMGVSTFEYFEKSQSLTLDNGTTVYVMRDVPVTEIQRRQSGENAMTQASPEDLERAAQRAQDAGREMEGAVRREIDSAGLPGGIGTMIMNPPPDEPWLSANPRDMTRNYAMMLRAGAESKRREAANDPAQATRDMQQAMAMVKSSSRIAGRETVGGRQAIIIESVDINHVQAIEGGGQFTTRNLRLAVDAEKNVPLRMEVQGVMTQGGESRDVTMVREDSDYRTVPGCGSMYKPFRSVMRMAGMMSEEEKAQMRQAQAQMADMEKQLAAMPPEQREMVMRQMGPQMKMMKSMSADGGMEIETSVTELRCNAGLPTMAELAQTALGGAAPAAGAGFSMPAAQGAAGQAAMRTPESASAAAASTTSEDAARQACLQEKIKEAEAARKKKRGFGSLLSAVSRTAGRLGNAAVGNAANEVSSASATADDLASAAKDLGITEDEIAACEQAG